jgi:superfamily II DNA/RNA helicase
MAQERRSAVVEGLLDARYSVIVTTNVLGRGLDLANVNQVPAFAVASSIHYQLNYSIRDSRGEIFLPSALIGESFCPVLMIA